MCFWEKISVLLKPKTPLSVLNFLLTVKITREIKQLENGTVLSYRSAVPFPLLVYQI